MQNKRDWRLGQSSSSLCSGFQTDSQKSGQNLRGCPNKTGPQPRETRRGIGLAESEWAFEWCFGVVLNGHVARCAFVDIEFFVAHDVRNGFLLGFEALFDFDFALGFLHVEVFGEQLHFDIVPTTQLAPDAAKCLRHMKPTRLAVIGFGRWGHFCHAALIRLAPGLELAGIASSDAGKRAQIEAELGVRAYDSLEAVILDDSVDALVLATPNDTHFDFAMRALDAGKHVVTDKPMCLSLGECDAMIERAQARGLLLTTFQNRRLDGDFLTLQHLIAGGELGELRWLELSWGGFGQWGGWRATIEHGGGKFLDLGAHLIDQALLLFPCPVTGVYLRLHHDHPDSPVESEAFLVLEFENGATAVCDTSSLSAISKPRFYARGTQATFCKYGLDPQENALMKSDLSRAEEDPATFGTLKGAGDERQVPTMPGRWRDFYENFALAAQGNGELLAPPQQTRRVMAVFEAARQSTHEGQLVRVSI